MTRRRRLSFPALVLLVSTLILPGRASATDACTAARALALWRATASRLHDLLGGPVPPPPRILIYREAQNLPNREPGLTVIGSYNLKSRQIRVSCSNGAVPVFDATVRHESTHYFLHSGIGRIPRWLDEGLATTMEAGSLKQGTPADHVNEARLREYLDMLKFGIVPHLADVMDGHPLALTPSQEYATYWSLVFALMYNADPAIQERRRALLCRLLATAALTKGNPGPAVERVFLDYIDRDGGDPHDWEMRWHREIWAFR
ncbi:MAG TPA: DUF1570 domain-containing protein [Stellaceae bacterium]|nr:DUF1570 domain-containing protein [Stellaceae bacterium]